MVSCDRLMRSSQAAIIYVDISGANTVLRRILFVGGKQSDDTFLMN